MDVLTVAANATLFVGFVYLAVGFWFSIASKLPTPVPAQPRQPLAVPEPVPPTVETVTAPLQEEITPPSVIIAPEPAEVPAPVVSIPSPEPKAKDTAKAPNITAIRKLCSGAQIKWRDAKGKGKHLSKDEMVQKLNSLGIAIA